MSWVRIKYENKLRKIISVYQDRESAINDWCIGDNIIEVIDIPRYVKETEDWNKSMVRLNSGKQYKAEIKKEIKEWDYERISDAGKLAIQNAINNSIDAHWLIVMSFYIKEKWATENFCCAVQIPQFKEKVYEMISSIKK